MLEHCSKQRKKSTPQALIYAPCVMVKKKKKINANCLCFQKYSKLLY